MKITYTALRDLMSGHDVSTNYTVGIGAQSMNPAHTIVGTQKRTLNGQASVRHYYDEKKFSIQTVPVLWLVNGTGQYHQMVEFLSSVSRGEQFTLDVNAMDGGPDVDPRLAMLDKMEYDIARISTTDYFTFSFNARLA